MSEELPDYIGHRQRLKERFKLGGGGDMADYEMLELLLTLAIPRKDTKPLAKALVKEFGSFAEVLFASDDKLMTFTGLKENTILVFRIVREAALRMTWQKLSATEAPVLTSYDAIIEYCRAASGYKDREEFRVIFLNAKNRIIGEEVQQRGSVNAVAIHPGEVMRSAVLKGATALIHIFKRKALRKVISFICLPNLTLNVSILNSPFVNFSSSQGLHLPALPVGRCPAAR